ncbi:MAG: hypothetical protein ACXADB_06145 [Candidatus Hermodarchaeia archaeon]
MMEDHEFCDDCPGCRPAMLNPLTGQVYPKDSPEMQAVDAVWDNETTYAERKAFIEVTLKNSRLPHELKLFEAVGEKMKRALENV